MKQYRVKPEYLESWAGGQSVDEVTVDDAEILRLAREWVDDPADLDAMVAELMEQVEEIDDDGDAAAEIVSAGLYDQAVNLMDDDIREELHQEIAPCTDEEFLRAYMERHLAKYGEEFTI